MGIDTDPKKLNKLFTDEGVFTEGEHGILVRPLEMFMDQKEVDGELVNRFEEIE